jgi:hypothetical protein
MDGDFFFGTSTLLNTNDFNDTFLKSFHTSTNEELINEPPLLLSDFVDSKKHEDPPLLSDLFDKPFHDVFTPYTPPTLQQEFKHDENNVYETLNLQPFLFNFEYDGKDGKENGEKKLKKVYTSGEIITLKRGRKIFNDDEKMQSKNDFIKYYQNIWRLLFRKNSTIPLSNYGKACCSYYANKTFHQCPSGKSPIHDLFRTYEHIWNVIEMGKDLHVGYGLTHFFFMKALIPWKKQTRFTVCPTKPDIEPLENDRVFQNGKYRTFLQEENDFTKNRQKNKKEMEILDEQITTLWNLIHKISGYEIPFEKGIPSMDLMMNVLQTLILSEDSFVDKHFQWPINPMELNFEHDLFHKNIFNMAKLLSLYGSLIRKSKHFNIDKGDVSAMPNIIFRKEDFYIVQQPKLGFDFLQGFE